MILFSHRIFMSDTELRLIDKLLRVHRLLAPAGAGATVGWLAKDPLAGFATSVVAFSTLQVFSLTARALALSLEQALLTRPESTTRSRAPDRTP
jgi:hypothetical protein